jgi:very-short-patch-repair endonuclease
VKVPVIEPGSSIRTLRVHSETGWWVLGNFVKGKVWSSSVPNAVRNVSRRAVRGRALIPGPSPRKQGEGGLVGNMFYKKKLFARILRKEATNEEIIVWEVLRNRKFMNLKFRRQHVIEGFVVDFYCHKLKLAVEIDGEIHNKQKDYDELRQCLIQDHGIQFIRMTNKEIRGDVNLLLVKISVLIPGPSPGKQGEGSLIGNVSC